ncbi:hypothetical protein vBPpSSYP_112 [Pseudomonas phage vB_PpS_SYP]|nr:hypothetical protein vBPpSSYP_112 [Pseudomonas phage vB_PpS_SYP]
MNIYLQEIDRKSYTGKIFEEYDVVGTSEGKYIVHCNVCSNDSQLFGNGNFLISSKGIGKGSKPCGCADKPLWNEDQYQVMMNRVAEDNGYSFVGWNGEFCGSKSRVVMSCLDHGDWSSSSIHDYKRYSVSCPKCPTHFVGNQKIDDDILIDRFLSTGVFAEGTRFTRSDERALSGFRIFWTVDCGLCKETYKSKMTDLVRGITRCSCEHRRFRQRELYLLRISDDSGKVLAMKYGIANDHKERIGGIRRSTKLNVDIEEIYKFNTFSDCIGAETAISRKFGGSFLSRETMKSGWTETLPYSMLPDVKNEVETIRRRNEELFVHCTLDNER